MKVVITRVRRDSFPPRQKPATENDLAQKGTVLYARTVGLDENGDIVDSSDDPPSEQIVSAAVADQLLVVFTILLGDGTVREVVEDEVSPVILTVIR